MTNVAAQAAMVVPSSLFCVFLSANLVYGIGQLPGNQITARPRKRNPEEGRKSPTRIQKRRQRSADNDCQEGDPLGVTYLGSINVTASGVTCQTWMDNRPHEHSHSDLGDHNFCRNPDGNLEGVWCFTNNPDIRWEQCSVPICVSKTIMTILDFSSDSDHELDSNGEYTSATLDAGALPESFAICSSFMVDAWSQSWKMSRI